MYIYIYVYVCVCVCVCVCMCVIYILCYSSPLARKVSTRSEGDVRLTRENI